MTFLVNATLEVTSLAPQIVLINPSASGVMLVVESVRIFGEQLSTMRIARYDVEIDVSSASGQPPAVYAADSGNAAGTVVSKDSHDITTPSANDLTLASLIFDNQGGQHLPMTEPIAVPPGSSFTVETATEFGGTGPTIGFQIEYQEVLVQPVAHIASAQLPAAGAFTTETYFDVPKEWSGLTFLVSYTADASSTNARPKWRVSWSDGTNEFIQPLVSESVDVSAAPVAARDQYQLVDRWPSGITANATVMFAVPVDRIPGLRKVRLDIAELGDATNRGTAAVTIMGA